MAALLGFVARCRLDALEAMNTARRIGPAARREFDNGTVATNDARPPGFGNHCAVTQD